MARQGELNDRGGSPWAVVLAGGEGVRLRPLVRRLCGDERPKQFVPLLGPRTLLRQTLDRVGLAIPPERTVVVGLEGHGRYLAGELTERPAPHLLKQPTDRGTAAAILFAAQWIEARDPSCNSRVLSFGPLHSGGDRVHGAGDRSGEVRRAAAGLDGPARGGADRTGDGVWLDRAWGIRGCGRGRSHLPHPAIPGEAFERSRGTIVHEGVPVEHVCLCRSCLRGARRGAGMCAELGRPAGPHLVVLGYRHEHGRFARRTLSRRRPISLGPFWRRAHGLLPL